MLLSEITLGQTYYTCCFIDGKKDVSSGVAKGKFEYEDGSCFVDLLLPRDQIVRPNVTDVFATAAEAVAVLEAYLSDKLQENTTLITSLKEQFNIVEEVPVE